MKQFLQSSPIFLMLLIAFPSRTEVVQSNDFNSHLVCEDSSGYFNELGVFVAQTQSI